MTRAWDLANPGNAAIREELASALLGAASPVLGRELLDAGCGTGWLLERLVADGRHAHGVDRDRERVAAAARRAPAAQVVEGDVCALPFDDGRFGAVFLVTVLSSLGSREAVGAAVREAWRVLEPGGRLIVWDARVPTPNRATRLVRVGDISRTLGRRPTAERTLTVAPPLARRLAARWYPRLASVPLLRSHRLAVWARPDGSLGPR